MAQYRVTQSSAGNSKWLGLNRQAVFSAGLAVTLSNGANLTYTVQHTFDDINKLVSCTVSRVTTTATLTFPSNHGLVVGDSLVIAGAPAPFKGTFAVASVVSDTVVTFTVANSGETSGRLEVVPLRVFNHEFMVGKTTSDDGNYSAPATATRLAVTAYTSGEATFTVIQGTHF